MSTAADFEGDSCSFLTSGSHSDGFSFSLGSLERLALLFVGLMDLIDDARRLQILYKIGKFISLSVYR